MSFGFGFVLHDDKATGAVAVSLLDLKKISAQVLSAFYRTSLVQPSCHSRINRSKPCLTARTKSLAPYRKIRYSEFLVTLLID